MTHGELSSRLDSFGKTERRVLRACAAVFFALPVVLIVRYFSDITLPVSDSVFEVLFWCWMLGPLGVAFVLMRQAQKRYGLLCPHCRWPLTHQYPLVLSSGLCNHCGSRVVDDTVQVGGAEEPPPPCSI
jgi:hypothetical protein